MARSGPGLPKKIAGLTQEDQTRDGETFISGDA